MQIHPNITLADIDQMVAKLDTKINEILDQMDIHDTDSESDLLTDEFQEKEYQYWEGVVDTMSEIVVALRFPNPKDNHPTARQASRA